MPKSLVPGNRLPKVACYPSQTTFHRLGEMGARRPFFVRSSELANVYERERTLEREISGKVEEALPGVEVLAVELNGPERFTVFVDRAEGVDLALCERVTRVLQEYLAHLRRERLLAGPRAAAAQAGALPARGRAAASS